MVIPMLSFQPQARRQARQARLEPGSGQRRHAAFEGPQAEPGPHPLDVLVYTVKSPAPVLAGRGRGSQLPRPSAHRRYMPV